MIKNPRQFILISLFTASALLTGCQALQTKSYEGLNTNQSLTINKLIKVPAHSARAFIQQGKLTSRQAFNRADQHCRLELKELSHQETFIHPGNFKITAITLDEEMVATLQKPVIIASIGDYQRPETMDLIHLELQSVAQPNVMRLTCAGSLSDGNLADAPQSYRPNLEMINQILGNYGSIN